VTRDTNDFYDLVLLLVTSDEEHDAGPSTKLQKRRWLVDAGKGEFIHIIQGK